MISNNFLLVKLFADTLKKKNYQWFDGPFNCNLIGVRSSNSIPNKFDDRLFYIAQDNQNNWFIKSYAITTDPGLPQLLNPSNPKGVAILVPNQYRSTYQLGYHQGRYEALVQRKPVKVYRDNDHDATHDFVSEDEGLFGINIHKAGLDSTQVDQWSAGCQVFAKEKEYNEFIALCKQSAAKYGNSFTYTLLEEKDFI